MLRSTNTAERLFRWVSRYTSPEVIVRPQGNAVYGLFHSFDREFLPGFSPGYNREPGSGRQDGLRAGLQLGSDGFVSFLLYGSRAELGIKAKLAVVNIDYTDGDETTSSDQSLLVGGIHGGFLLGPGGDAVDFGVGVEFRLGIGEIPHASVAFTFLF